MSDPKAVLSRAREAAAKALWFFELDAERGPIAPEDEVDALADLMWEKARQEVYLNRFSAALAAYEAEIGKELVLVPREATEEMIVAGVAERHGQPVPEAWSLATQNIYRAMIEAASGVAGEEGREG